MKAKLSRIGIQVTADNKVKKSDIPAIKMMVLAGEIEFDGKIYENYEKPLDEIVVDDMVFKKTKFDGREAKYINGNYDLSISFRKLKKRTDTKKPLMKESEDGDMYMCSVFLSEKVAANLSESLSSKIGTMLSIDQVMDTIRQGLKAAEQPDNYWVPKSFLVSELRKLKVNCRDMDRDQIYDEVVKHKEAILKAVNREFADELDTELTDVNNDWADDNVLSLEFTKPRKRMGA